MTLDLFLNIILFAARVLTAIFTFILAFNLLAEWRGATEESSGLQDTRVTMVILIVSLLLENFLYTLAYIHGGFDTLKLNQWITDVKPLFILSRWGIFVAVLRLFLLFYRKHKEE
jgi:hypothetical protein